MQPMRDPPHIARVVNDGKMVQKRAKAGLLVENSKGKAHGGAPNQTAPTESRKTQSVNRR